MTRRYIRLDPAFDEHKESYPDGAYAAFIATLCLAESQPERGRFRSVGFLRAILGKRGRWVAYLVEHGDLVPLPDGHVYLDGWDEWQEGDWKVQERVDRIRNRTRRRRMCNAPITPPVTVPVTPDVTIGVTPLRSAGFVRALLSAAVHSGALQPDVSKTNGTTTKKGIPADDELAERYRAKLADPSVSEEVKAAVRFQLEAMGHH